MPVELNYRSIMLHWKRGAKHDDRTLPTALGVRQSTWNQAGNFLIDDNANLVLIDWQQSGAPATILADDTWTVRSYVQLKSREAGAYCSRAATGGCGPTLGRRMLMAGV